MKHAIDRPAIQQLMHMDHVYYLFKQDTYKQTNALLVFLEM